jgi:thiamine kinase-like enzyme
MQQHTPACDTRVLEVQLVDVDSSASILASLASAHTDLLIGHFGMNVTFTTNGDESTVKMVMKIKPHGDEIVAMLNMLAQACGGKLASVYDQHKAMTGFQYTHLREQEIYRKLKPAFTPVIYGMHTNDEDRVYIILMEYLDEVELLNSVMAVAYWHDEHIKKALQQMAEWHSSMFTLPAELNKAIWPDVPTFEYMNSLQTLWPALLYNAAEKFPELYTHERVEVLQQAIDSLQEHWPELEQLPKTLIHNDLNPRNSCFKNTGGKLAFCLYDWELATFHIPQYDVAEFLCFVLDEDRYHKRQQYVDFYRNELNRLTGSYGDATAFNRHLHLAALHFGMHRLGMYMMAHTVSPYPFLPRVVNSFFNMVMHTAAQTAATEA